MSNPLDPTLHVVLLLGSRRREYQIFASKKLDAWPFIIDRGKGMPEIGIITGPERVLERKAQLESEIAQLVADGWRVV
jgi:hypothetical protein